MKKKLDGKLIGIWVAVVIAVLVSSVFLVNSFKNKAITLEEAVKTAKSNISVQEKKRVDSVYNLADVVKEHSKHVSETFIEIAKTREGQSPETYNADIENIQTQIKAVNESYPDLKTDATYMKLMNDLTKIENTIADYRTNYNKCVEKYNRYVAKFPSSFFLAFSGYQSNHYERIEFEDAPHDAPQNLFD